MTIPAYDIFTKLSDKQIYAIANQGSCLGMKYDVVRNLFACTFGRMNQFEIIRAIEIHEPKLVRWCQTYVKFNGKWEPLKENQDAT